MKQVPIEQVLKRLTIENSWWNDEKIPSIYQTFKPRAYLELFYPLVHSRKVQRANVLMGPRRVGKTVMIHHAIQKLINDNISPKKIGYISVDHPIYNGLSLDTIIETFTTATGINYTEDMVYIFFDEIQYLKNWELHLKAIVDRNPNIKCTVSGSAAAALKLKSNESGAGRFTDFLLPPLTFHEYLFLLEKNDLVEKKDGDSFFISSDLLELNRYFIKYLNFGGYPEVIFSEEIQSNPGRYIKSDIIDKVLLRDLPGLYGVQDIQELNYLFTTLAFNTSNEVSLEELSKGSGVAKNTIKRYIEYLEAAFLIRTVHRIDRNAKRFERANFFKVYLTNPSIRSALFSPIDENDSSIGALCETAIYSQWFHAESTNLHYARWKDGEVDIVNLNEKHCPDWAIEVKWTDRFYDRPRDLKPLRLFCHSNNLRDVLVTTLTQTGNVTIDNININFIPASIYCYTVGYNIIKGKNKK